MTPLLAQSLEGVPIPSDWPGLLMLALVLFLLFGQSWGQAIVSWWSKAKGAQIEDNSKKEAHKLDSEEAEQKWHVTEATEARKRADAWLTRYLDRIEGENKAYKRQLADKEKELEDLRKERDRYKDERNRFAQGVFLIQQNPGRAQEIAKWTFDERFSDRLLDFDGDSSLPGIELLPSLDEITGEITDAEEEDDQ